MWRSCCSSLAGGGPNSAPLAGLVGILFVFTVAELLLSPVGLSVTTRLAPKAFRTPMIALFFLSIAIGTALSGTLAKYYSPESERAYFAILGIIAIAVGARAGDRQPSNETANERRALT